MKEESDTRLRKTVQNISLQETPGTSDKFQITEDGSIPSESAYEFILWLLSYYKMFLIRLCKDLYSAIMSYFTKESVLPEHISNLVNAHKQFQTERESTSIASYNLIKHEENNMGEQIINNTKFSEDSWDSILSYVDSVPQLTHSGSNISHTSSENLNSTLREAIEFLHQDKEFLVAAELGNERLLEMYIRRGTNVQQVDHLGRNALHLAVCTGNIRAIKLLLDSGVDPNVKDNVGMTPLSLSLMRRPSLIIANLLFDHGAIIIPRTNTLDSGLFIQFVMMCTPTDEEENILKLLIQKGAIINDPSAPGKRQPLHFAAMSNNLRLVRLLVSLGADLNMKNHRNETPKETANTFGCREAYNFFCELEEMKENTMSVDIDISKEE